MRFVTAMTEQEPTPVDFWFGTLLPVCVDRFSVDARSELDRGQAVWRCAQSARWARQFALARWGRLSPLVWLSRVRDGQAMTQGGAIEAGIPPASRVGYTPRRVQSGSGWGWRQLAGVVP